MTEEKVRETFSNADILILAILYKSSSGLAVFTLFRRSKLSSNVFFERYLGLLEKGVFIESDDFVSLTDKGKALAVGFLPKLGMAEKPWRKVPVGYLGDKLQDGGFYIPNIYLLNRRAFNL